MVKKKLLLNNAAIIQKKKFNMLQFASLQVGKVKLKFEGFSIELYVYKS